MLVLLDGRLQYDPAVRRWFGSAQEQQERLAWVILHELLSHATARVRGHREPHSDPGQPATTADRVSAVLDEAMRHPQAEAYPDLEVPWDWDADAGVQ